jgi:hypothetical protein
MALILDRRWRDRAGIDPARDFFVLAPDQARKLRQLLRNRQRLSRRSGDCVEDMRQF